MAILPVQLCQLQGKANRSSESVNPLCSYCHNVRVGVTLVLSTSTKLSQGHRRRDWQGCKVVPLICGSTNDPLRCPCKLLIHGPGAVRKEISLSPK